MTDCLHPGGLALTEKLLQMAALPPGARILDLGCGEGTTVHYLQRAGYDAFGIDLIQAAHSCIITGEMRRPFFFDRVDPTAQKPQPGPDGAGGKPAAGGSGDGIHSAALVGNAGDLLSSAGEVFGRAEASCPEPNPCGQGKSAGRPGGCGRDAAASGGEAEAMSGITDREAEAGSPRLIQGDMRSLPFETESFDGVLAECSLLSCGDRDAALAESLRVLRPGGAILASDLFFPATDGEKAEACAGAFARAGFSVLRLEDASPYVQEYFLQFIWNYGCLPEAWKKLTAGRKKVGYYLIYGRKL